MRLFLGLFAAAIIILAALYIYGGVIEPETRLIEEEAGRVETDQ